MEGFSSTKSMGFAFSICSYTNYQFKLKTSEISLFKNQPFYFVELSRDWAVYHFDKDNYVKEGEKFDISGIDHLSKYDRHYHRLDWIIFQYREWSSTFRGLLYLFRENSTACIDYVNNKVVRVEGPLLDIYACVSYCFSMGMDLLPKRLILMMKMAHLIHFLIVLYCEIYFNFQTKPTFSVLLHSMWIWLYLHSQLGSQRVAHSQHYKYDSDAAALWVSASSR